MTFEVWLVKMGREKKEGEQTIKARRRLETTRTQLTNVKEQISLLGVVHLEFIHGVLKYLY